MNQPNEKHFPHTEPIQCLIPEQCGCICYRLCVYTFSSHQLATAVIQEGKKNNVLKNKDHQNQQVCIYVPDRQHGSIINN